MGEHPTLDAVVVAPPCEKPPMQPQATQRFLLPGTGPTSGLPSGVKVKAPFTQRLMPTSASAGKRA